MTNTETGNVRLPTADLPFTPDVRFMEAAIDMAFRCNDVEHPVGAVIVKDGEIVSKASNEAHRDPMYHAERLAIAGAQIALNSRRLHGCEMYTTLEPCTLLCAGPILVSRLAVVVYGAESVDAQSFAQRNAGKSWMTNEISFTEVAQRTPMADTRIVGGFLRDECIELFSRTPRSAETGRLHITSLKSVEAGVSRVCFTLDSKEYDMEAPFGSEALLAWFPGYIAKAPHCAACDRLIFPSQPVAQGHFKTEDSGFSHLDCCDTAAGYAGWFNDGGELVPAFS
jgi:tRNA(Arg) A34 adenosine deaminase TadA